MTDPLADNPRPAPAAAILALSPFSTQAPEGQVPRTGGPSRKSPLRRQREPIKRRSSLDEYDPFGLANTHASLGWTAPATEAPTTAATAGRTATTTGRIVSLSRQESRDSVLSAVPSLTDSVATDDGSEDDDDACELVGVDSIEDDDDDDEVRLFLALLPSARLDERVHLADPMALLCGSQAVIQLDAVASYCPSPLLRPIQLSLPTTTTTTTAAAFPAKRPLRRATFKAPTAFAPRSLAVQPICALSRSTLPPPVASLAPPSAWDLLTLPHALRRFLSATAAASPAETAVPRPQLRRRSTAQRSQATLNKAPVATLTPYKLRRPRVIAHLPIR